MKKIHKIKKICFLFFVLTLILGSCAKSPSSVMEEGAQSFADGKEEEDYNFMTSDQILEKMMDEFAGSFGQPEENDISDDEAEKIVEDTDDDDKIVKDDTSDAVASDEQLQKVVHEMLKQTKTSAKFKVADGYTFDIYKVFDMYDRLMFEDATNTVGVASGSAQIVNGYGIINFWYDMDVNTYKAMKKEERSLVEKAKKEMDSIYNLDDASDSAIVEAVNEYLCDKMIYPDADMSKYPDSNGYAPEHHTAYNGFKNGYVVCDGYSRCAKLLLNEYGVDCGIEVGECIPSGGHAWNLVKVDGKWYQMDVTWNDGAATYDKNARKEYFLQTDAFMKESRTWQYSWYPTTPSTRY